MERYKKTEPKDKIWIIPLLAGLCAIIAILVPTANFSYGGVTWDWWMWDLTVMGAIGYTSVSSFVPELDFIIPSVITTSIVLLSAVNLFILTNSTKKNNINTKKFELNSILSAAFLIGIIIYYVIAMDFAFFDGVIMEGSIFPPGYHFWDAFGPSFGVILPLLSAILLFIGVGVFRYYLKRREDILSIPKMEILEENIPAKLMGNLIYCPECGFKLHSTDANFCTNCGFKFQ